MILIGLDIHLGRITFDAVDTESGEARSGPIRPAEHETAPLPSRL
jgi:hypothetical protein